MLMKENMDEFIILLTSEKYGSVSYNLLVIIFMAMVPTYPEVSFLSL